MARTERQPRASDVEIPVFVPSTNGQTSLEMGKASLKAGVLIIEFKNNLPGVAIQRMIERGVLLGFSFVMLKEDEVNLQAQERLANIEAAQAEQDEEDLARLVDEELTPEDIIEDTNNEQNDTGEN